MYQQVKIERRERFFRLNDDGTLGGGGGCRDVPAGTTVPVVSVEQGMYLLRHDGDPVLHARVWASFVRRQ